MNLFKTLGLWPSGWFFRRFGFWTSVWAVAFAAFQGCWQASFLIGVFLLGLGIGLGDWVMGGDCK